MHAETSMQRQACKVSILYRANRDCTLLLKRERDSTLEDSNELCSQTSGEFIFENLASYHGKLS
jgi:hypothetical protein